MRTADAARGRWYGILKSLGIDDQYLRNRHGECPMCGGHDRYRWDNRNDDGGYYCNGCGAGDGFALLMGCKGWTFAEAAKEVDALVGNQDVPMDAPKPAKPDPRVRLRKVAQSLMPMDGINPVRLYLQSRGLAPTSETKYCPRMPYYHDGQLLMHYPAMIHLLRGADGAPMTYHITYLDAAGRKAPVEASKKILPPAGDMLGGAIQLMPHGRLLGIAEGIETAMAASKLFNVPVWAAYSSHMLANWQPPVGVEAVVIFGDNDFKYAGQAAAFALAARMANAGKEVAVRMPDVAGTDWADHLGGERAAEARV